MSKFEAVARAVQAAFSGSRAPASSRSPGAPPQQPKAQPPSSDRSAPRSQPERKPDAAPAPRTGARIDVTPRPPVEPRIEVVPAPRQPVRVEPSVKPVPATLKPQQSSPRVEPSPKPASATLKPQQSPPRVETSARPVPATLQPQPSTRVESAPKAAPATLQPQPSAPRVEPAPKAVPATLQPQPSARVEPVPATKESPAAEPVVPKPEGLGRGEAPTLDWGFGPDSDQALLDDLDAGFYMIVQGKTESGEGAAAEAAAPAQQEARGERPEDVVAVREMFEQLAPFYAKPIRDFLIESAWGDPPKTWLSITLPAARALRQAAEKMSLPELGVALADFVAALEVAESAPGAHVGKEAKDFIAGAYERLVTVMPKVFALEQERSVREPIIVHAMLQQVPGLGKVAIDRIYAAGLSQLEMFYTAKPGDIAAATGIPLATAQVLCGRFRAYRDEVQQTAPDQQRQAERKKLEELAHQLRGLNQTFKGASTSWSAQAAKDKRWLRTERERLFLEMTVVLARIGEVELLRRLERLPFERKVAELEAFLTENRGGGQAGG